METSPTQDNKQKKIPKWLFDIQNNSWNPELLISGLSIVFLFSISGQISEYSILLIQEYGFNPVLVYFASIYVSLAFTALQYLFAFHLILRGVWVGWIGLSYVFPRGVQFDKLPKIAQQDYVKKEIGDPIDRVMMLERVCSSTFSLAFTFVGLSFIILFFFIIAFVLDAFGVNFLVNLGMIFGGLLIISMINPLNYYLSKRTGKEEIRFLSKTYLIFARLMSLLFYRDSMMTFQTNIPKVRFAVYGFIIVFPLVILSTNNIIKTAKFSKFALTNLSFLSNTGERHRDGVMYNNYYLDRMQVTDRIQKASIPSAQIKGAMLEVFMADYRWDKKVFDEIVTHDSSNYSIGPLLKVKLDGKEVEVNWFENSHPLTQQKGWVAYVPIASHKIGEHRLSIDKWLWNYEKNQSEFEEDYCLIPFWKVD